ncbi:MAG: hypothetical protein WDW36_008176 [Sanguina aurantia]
MVDVVREVSTEDRFKTIQVLGSGTFGFVRLVQDIRTKKLMALKSLRRSLVSKYVADEIVNHAQLRHPHVVQFRQVYLSRDHVNILMEHANGGSLFSMVHTEQRIKEPLCRWFFQQLILAIDYCHKKGVANRDIKLENLLLHQAEGSLYPLLKVCDFGYSKADSRSAGKSQVGTLPYMAPEVIRSELGSSYDGKLADIWSCGVVLYVTLYGRYPFEGPKDCMLDSLRARTILDKMEQEQLEFPAKVEVSAACIALLRRLLCPRPEERITLAEVIGNPWFQKKLPTAAFQMSETCLRLPPHPEYQTEAQIREEGKEKGGSSPHSSATRRPLGCPGVVGAAGVPTRRGADKRHARARALVCAPATTGPRSRARVLPCQPRRCQPTTSVTVTVSTTVAPREQGARLAFGPRQRTPRTWGGGLSEGASPVTPQAGRAARGSLWLLDRGLCRRRSSRSVGCALAWLTAGTRNE